MPDMNYLETVYSRDEYSETNYPQKLCDYLIKTFKLSGRMLDVGSGKGSHLVGFKRRGFEVKGLDARPECIKVLKGFDIRKCDIETESFPFEDASFDFVFSKSVLEHISNSNNLFDQILRVLKPGGLVILMVPDWGTQYRTYWDDPTHVKAWTRKSLQNIMRMIGFGQVNCSLFRQLPILWKYPRLKILCDIVALLPNSLKWKDTKEEEFRVFIRFSKEKMLLATGIKL